jgi:hypothetical protein
MNKRNYKRHANQAVKSLGDHQQHTQKDALKTPQAHLKGDGEEQGQGRRPTMCPQRTIDRGLLVRGLLLKQGSPPNPRTSWFAFYFFENALSSVRSVLTSTQVGREVSESESESESEIGGRNQSVVIQHQQR